MANNKLSRSQKELVAKIKGTEVTRYIGGGIDNSYPLFSNRVIQQKTMEQLVSLGYAKEIRREKQTGSVEKVTYLIVDLDAPILNRTATQKVNGIGRLKKAAVREILEKGGYYEEVEGLRMEQKYYMGQERLNAAWHNDWREQGLVESYEREYYNGTYRGCKWRWIGAKNGQ